MPRYVNTRQLCSALGLSERTIRRYIASGKLPASQFTGRGRIIFDIREVQEALRMNRKSA